MKKQQGTMKTRTPKKTGSTPPVKKGGNKTPAKAGASPAQAKVAISDAVTVPIPEQETKPETSHVPIADTVKIQEATLEVQIEATSGPKVGDLDCKVDSDGPAQVNGDPKKEGHAGVSTETPQEPVVPPAKSKGKLSTPKKRILSPRKGASPAGQGVPQTETKEHVGSASVKASEPPKSVSEKNVGEKDVKFEKAVEKKEQVSEREPAKEKTPLKETKTVPSKGKEPSKGSKKSTAKGKGPPKAVKKDLEHEKEMSKEPVKEEESEVSKDVPKEVEEVQVKVKDTKEVEPVQVKVELLTEMEVEDEAGDVEMEEKDEQEDEVAEEVEDYGEEGIEKEEMSGEEENEEEEEGGEDGEGEEGDEADVLEPRPVTERQKRKKLEVFVGGLDKDATEDDLKVVFQKVGEVVEVRLMKHPLTGKNKGYAFIRFGNAEQATRAATELARTQVRGRECGVVPSQDNDTLFLGNISRAWKSEQVIEKLKEYGITGIEEVSLMEDPQNQGLNRGFAFLELATHNDAVKAFQRLQQPDAIFGSDRSAKIAWAQPLNEPDDVVMSQVKSVFVDGMPATWNDDKVKEHFGKFGEIERIVFARNMPVARRKDFAFVNYVTREGALACIEAFKDADLTDGDNKVKVKVSLARPLPKGRSGKGGVRGGYPLGRGGRGGRAGRGEGWFHGGRFGLRKPIRGGRGFVRGGRGIAGRGGKPLYDDEDVHHLLMRALREQEDRSMSARGRRPSGVGFPRISRGSARGSYSRRDDDRRDDPRRADPRRDDLRRIDDEDYARGSHPRSDHEYGDRRGSSSRRGALRDEHVARRGGPSPGFSRGRGTNPGRRSSPPREDGYSQRYERGHAYGRDVGGGLSSGVRDYDEAGLGMKRPFSALDDDPSYYDPGHRGYPRARADYADPGPLAPSGSQYQDSVRPPPGRSSQHGLGAGAGRTGLSSAGGGPAPPPLSIYESGSALGNPGSSSLYAPGNHGYGSVLPGTNDYISDASEMRRTSLHASSFYGGRSGSGGYNLPSAGAGSYY